MLYQVIDGGDIKWVVAPTYAAAATAWAKHVREENSIDPDEPCEPESMKLVAHDDDVLIAEGVRGLEMR